MPQVKHGNYILKDGDVDLQDDPPAQGVAATSKVGTAKERALAELRARTGVHDLSWDDFAITARGPDHLTGGNAAVEWRATRKRSDTDFTFIIDMDDVPPGLGGHGPDRPHVGYSYWGTGGRHRCGRFNGHVFIEKVPATRNDPIPYRR